MPETSELVSCLPAWGAGPSPLCPEALYSLLASRDGAKGDSSGLAGCWPRLSQAFQQGKRQTQLGQCREAAKNCWHVLQALASFFSATFSSQGGPENSGNRNRPFPGAIDWWVGEPPDPQSLPKQAHE